ncbi:hypothetical protein MC7420_6640 [Coleofasciculus chthonoplastes PCC 7420]|uniref:SMP-30/Gluconolactonase/LRE-like region domain-containing protein n=1 Tax=Coleofasciculus chthonoplastes PCC 7420 TaxID=118168 RepID=B4W465_9CYAN|nr:hypothetical protein [Coleofasciculus chthonoplastes]EDX71040.1 hypothetical protein MC7420_6640 [Coleofasciculus chthonoplastes PCC 7420]
MDTESKTRNISSLAWGDDDYKSLYITTSNSLYRIRLKIPGVPPGKI